MSTSFVGIRSYNSKQILRYVHIVCRALSSLETVERICKCFAAEREKAREKKNAHSHAEMDRKKEGKSVGKTDMERKREPNKL